MNQNINEHSCDWTQNWNSSIAIKLTGIILWSVTLVAFIISTPIMVNYEENKLKEYLWTNHEITDLIVTKIKANRSGSDVENELKHFIDDSTVEFISIKSTDLDISLGHSSEKNYQFSTTHSLTKSNQSVAIHIQHQELKRALLIGRITIGGIILISAFLFGMFIFLVTHKVLNNPMRQFVNLTHKLSKGEKDIRFDEAREDEFGELARFSNTMLENLELQREKLLDTNKELTSEMRHREEALAASQQKSAFLANMSHEIRTPLSSIIGYTERLRYKTIKNKDERNCMMDIVLQSSSHLLNLINDILDFSKIEANKLEMDVEDFSIFHLVSQTVNLLSDKSMEQSTHIKVEYVFPIPKLIINDATRTKQVLLNICSNALRFTKNGIITFSISFDQNNNQLVIAVKDTGIGMSEKVLGRLFKPYSQGEVSTSKNYGGTGLGLTISKRLCELMGGDISAKSTEGLGSIFTFRIKAGFNADIDLAYEIDKAAIETYEYNKPLENFMLSGKVLLIEDTTAIRLLVKSYLEDYGIEVTTAENGKQGTQLALSGAFDVVLMDIHMPVMNGKEAVTLLRDNKYSRPVIALTADALTQQVEEYIALGFTQVLTKPIIVNDLFNTLSTYLDSDDKPHQADSTISIDAEPAETDHDHKDINPHLKTELGQRLVKKFINEMPNTIKDIEVALAKRDIVSLKDIFHQLKGLGGSVGFPVVTQLATDIEVPLAREDYDDIRNKTNELNELCDRLLNTA